LIATPATNRIHAVNAANMNQMWVSPVLADNCTGEALMLSGSPKIYVAAGTRVYRLTNNGNDASIDAGWPFDAGATVNSGPLPYRGKVFFGRTNGRYYALDDNTAGLVDQWPFSSVSGDGDIGPWIDVTNNRVLFASTGSDLHAFDVP
jgi:outer membrane protein assembly factor BamB